MRSPCIVKHLLLTGLLLALLQICHTFSKAKTSCISSFTSMVQTWNRFDVHLGTSGDEWRRVFIRKMRGERSIDRMRIYSSEIEDDLFDSLAEDFYSSTVFKEDHETSKKPRRQSTYDDEEYNFDTEEEDMKEDEESLRYQKKKKPLRHNNFRKTELLADEKNPLMTEVRYYIQQHFSKLCKLIIRDFQEAYVARFGKEGSKKGFLWRDIRTACYITQWSGDKRLEAKRVFIRNRMKDFLYSHELNDELFWEVMDIEWDQYGAELVLPPPSEEQLAKSNARRLKEGKEPLTMPKAPPYPNMDRNGIIKRIFEIGREIRDFEQEEKIQEMLELYEKTIDPVESDKLRIRRHDR